VGVLSAMELMHAKARNRENPNHFHGRDAAMTII
jgi:hypothetical protein